MKKFILSLVFLFPTLVFATSGACSGHGGVSCSAGSDSDGSVICSDGWRNSSVSYSSMIMCSEYPSTSTYTVPKTEPIITPTPVEPNVTQTIPPVNKVINEPAVETKVITPISTPKPKVKKSIPPKKTISEPIKAVVVLEKEIAPSSPTVEKNIQEIQTPKKKSFWARLFNFLF